MTADPENSAGTRGRAINILIILSIIAANLIIYFRIHSYDVALSDEVFSITAYQDGITIQNLKKAFGGSSIHTSYWAPVSFLFCMIDAELFGHATGPRHLVNLFFHIGSSLLLFSILFKTTRQSWPSGLAAILFAIHPLNVESVAWLASHDNSLSVFFILLGLLTYLGYLKRPILKHYLLLTFLMALGLMASPKIIFFPFLLLLLDYWPLHRISFEKEFFPYSSKNPIIEKAPLFIFICLWVIGSWLFFNYSDFARLRNTQAVTPSFLSAFFEAPISYMGYIGKIFYPSDLAPARLLPPHLSSLTQKTISAMLLIGITGLAFFCARQGRRYVLMGWLWFIVCMAPGVTLDAMKPTLITDRYAYVGAIGIFIIISWGAKEIIAKLRYKKIISGIVGILIVLVLICISSAQTRHWQNRVSLLNHVINLAPENKNIYWMLGDALRDANKKTEALKIYNKTLQMIPDSATLYNSIGLTQGEVGETQNAFESFKKALELEPEYADAYHNMGNLLFNDGKIDQAIACFEAALRIKPSLYQTHNSLAVALIMNGQINKATGHLREALRINPYYETAQKNLDKINAVRKMNSD